METSEYCILKLVMCQCLQHRDVLCGVPANERHIKDILQYALLKLPRGKGDLLSFPSRLFSYSQAVGSGYFSVAWQVLHYLSLYFSDFDFSSLPFDRNISNKNPKFLKP